MTAPSEPDQTSIASDAPATTAPAANTPGRWPRMQRSFSSLAIRDFRYLVVGTLASTFGQWAKTLGYGWLVFELTGSATQLAGVSFVRGAVGLLAAPWGGVLLDRANRRHVLVTTTTLNATKGAALAVLIVTDVVRPEYVYVFAFADGLLSSVESPARQAVVHDVTTEETLPNAITVNTLAMNISRVTGPPFIGALIGIGGSATAFTTLAILSGVAAILTLQLKSSSRQGLQRPAGGPLRNLREGLRYISSDRPILGLVVATLIPSLLVYPYIALLPIFADEVLDSGALGYGLLSSGLGWGSLVGLSVFALTGSNPPRRGTLLLLGGLGYIGLVLAFSQSRDLGLSFGLLVAAGVSNSVWWVLTTTLIQTLARDEVRGRVLGVWQMAGSATPLAVLPMGLLVDAVGPADGVAIFTSLAFALMLMQLLWWRSLREA